MITQADIQDAERPLAEIDSIKTVCMCCGAHLGGSPEAERESHGLCKPLCGSAREMGWRDQTISGSVTEEK